MLGLLAADGIIPVSYDPTHPDASMQADAVVVNTCGFLEASKDESLSVIKDAIEQKKNGVVKRVVVAGCLVQRHRAKMLDWAPGIDAMVGVFDRDHIVHAVRGTTPQRETVDNTNKDKPRYWIHANALTKARDEGLQTVGLTVNGKDGRGVGYFEDDAARLRLTPRHYAYLRISEGCNQACAFCTIPSIRGKMRSKPMEKVTAELRELLADGAFEINLIGQDTTSFGDDIGIGFDQQNGAHGGLFARGGLPDLLKSLSDTIKNEVGHGWIRLMYAYPTSFRDEYIDAFAALVKEGHLCPYIDIPLQHASDRMLSAMRRNVTSHEQSEVLRKLRERVPGMAIRTTFITGFPGETEADHQELLAFIDAHRFDAMGVFEYSKEDGTPAGTMENDPSLAVPAETKRRRHNELMELQQRIAFAKNKARAAMFDEKSPETTGERIDVLIDNPTSTAGTHTTGVSSKGMLYQGRTNTQAPTVDSVTFVHSTQKLVPGELVKCVVVGSDGYDLIARPVEQLRVTKSLPVIS